MKIFSGWLKLIKAISVIHRTFRVGKIGIIRGRPPKQITHFLFSLNLLRTFSDLRDKNGNSPYLTETFVSFI